MAKYSYEIKIEANTENEATKKMEAVTALVSKLNEKELTKLAHIIQNEPAKTALAKRFLGV